MIRTCTRCQDNSAPDEAKFCVACGYPLRQPCPYHEEGCQSDQWVSLTTLNRPSWRCPHCRGFYRYCSCCWRLYSLSQAECETNPEHCVHPPLQESFAAWAGVGANFGHTYAVEIPTAWDGSNRNFEPLRVTGQVYGLVYRYGLLCFVAGTTLYTLPCHSRRKVNMTQERPYRLELNHQPLTGEGTINDPHTLIVEHGSAYVLTSTQAIRADLWHGRTFSLPGRFRKQFCTPTRWIGIGEDDSGKMIACECPAYSNFAPSRCGVLQTFPAQSGRFNLANLTDIVADGETIYVAFRDVICLFENGSLQIYWESGDRIIESLAVYNGELLVLCRDAQGARLIRLTHGQESRFSMRFASLNPYRHPVLMGGFVYLFDNQNHQILRYSLDQEPPRAQTRELLGGAEVVAAMGTWRGEHQWLLLGLQTGRGVQFQILEVQPEFAADRLAGSLLSAERRLSAVVADGQLVVAATSEADRSIRLYRLTQDAGEEGEAYL